MFSTLTWRTTADTALKDGYHGALNALISLGLVLTLGLLAFAPLGPNAVAVGLPSAFAGVIVGGTVFALLGRSAAPVVAPSTATAMVLAAGLARVIQDPTVAGASAAGIATLIAVAGASVLLMGLLQIAFGIAGLGRLSKYVPKPVLAGFMNGIALLVILSQLPALLGLPRLAALFSAETWAHTEPWRLLLGLGTAGLIWWIARRWPRVPAGLVGLLAGGAVYTLLSSTLPSLVLGPTLAELMGPVNWPTGPRLLSSALLNGTLSEHAAVVIETAAVLAVIGTLESMLAVATIEQHPNAHPAGRRELVALGLANATSGLVGGLPLMVSRVRAMPLLDTPALGARPALVAVATLALIFAFGEELLKLLPSAVLAGLMLTVAVALSDSWSRQLLRQWRAGEGSAELRTSLGTVVLVCAVTVWFGFVAAVLAGTLLTMLLLVVHMNRSLVRSRHNAAERPSRRLYAPAHEALLHVARQRVQVLALEGALFFGSVERLEKEIDAVAANCRCVVLDLRRVGTIDESGATMVQQLSQRLARRGVALLLAGVGADNRHGRSLRTFGCFRESPRTDWWPDADRAIEAAEALLLADARAVSVTAAVSLEKSLLLRGLNSAQCQVVKAAMPARRLAAGEPLFAEGDAADRLYVLTEGSVSIVHHGAGPDQRFASFAAGVIFGETAMLDGQGRSADAIADGDATVHELTSDALDALIAADAALGARLMRNIALHLSERLRSASAAWADSAA